MINKKAVTIVELMVTITILTILATTGFILVKGWTNSARDTVRIDHINNINTAIDLYKVNRGQYPEPTDPIDVTYSGAIVWTQGGFGKDTIRQTGRIFGEIKDPTYGIDYTYSVTNSRKEYQLSYVLEDPVDNLTSSVDLSIPGFVETAYADGEFSPDEFNPIIWLDGEDIDGDGDTADNPSNNSNVTDWVNKSTAGATNNPTLTDGNLKYSTSGFDGSYPGVFIASNRGLRLDNSAISNGDIFYVVQNNDPFNNTDKKGRGLQSTTGNYLIGYWDRRRNSLYINGAPSEHASSPSTKSNRTVPFVYSYHADGSNYSFRDTGNVISQGAANSISGREWGFNKAGNYNEKADFVVSEILVYSSPLSASEREKVEGYLAHKWGQEYWLPSNHPYKSSPPDGGTPPPPPDTTPDVFSLNAVTDASLSAEFISNAITVTGINTSASISVTGGGTYNINGGSYTSTAGSVNENDVIRVKQTSSTSNSTAVNTTLSIDSVSDTFTVTTLDGDTAPDSFSFSPVSDADVSTVYTSNSVTITGINTATPISISGGDAEYRIVTGVSYDAAASGTASASSTDALNTPDEAFDNNLTEGWGTNNVLPGWIEYDLGSGNTDIVNKYTLYRDSSQPGYWWASDSPRDWRFEGSNNGSSWIVLDTQADEYINWNVPKTEYSFSNSTAYRYYRLYITDSNASDGSDWANITEIEFINDGVTPYTNTSGTVNNGESVTVIMTSGASAGTTETATLTVGSVSEDFDITTLAPDTTPDSFSFTDVDDASLSTQYTSNTATISGINTATAISISGVGEYNINGGSYTSSAGTVNSGDTVMIRQTSSASNSITVASTLDVGGVQAVYNVTTPAPPPDTTPDSFTFVDQIDANQSTQYISNSITVSGINADTSINVSGGGEYDINGSRSYTSSAGTVSNGDIISVRDVSSPSIGSTTNTTLIIGGISDTYSITTIPPDTVPDVYVLGYVTEAILNKTYNSSPITVSGINVGTTIDITGGGGKYNINGGSWQSGSDTVYNGDVVIVHLQSLASGNTNVSTTLDIGGVTADFDITTVLDADDTPDVFTFNDVTGANLNSIQTDTITISGTNTSSAISISGAGDYSINGDPYTSAAGTVLTGDTVTVRQTASSEKSTSVNSTITIGGLSDVYTVTTIAEEPELSSVTARDLSSVYVSGDFNGLFAHGVSPTNGNHYVFITPSIIATDLSSTNFLDIINDKKFVYTGYNNHPATYTSANDELTTEGGFDQYRISGPIIFEGSKQDLTSYTGIKQVDNGVRSTYRTTELYRTSAKYLDNPGTGYVEDILGNIIGINPIKPYYCSDILDKEFTENIATQATVTATSNTNWGTVSGTGGIVNDIKSTQGDLDYEYHSDTANAFINLEWEEDQPVGFIRIYNRTGCCSSRLSGAIISLYDATGGLLYSHTLWDTTNDYVVDLDLEGIGHLYDNVRQVKIESQGSDSYLNIREVAVYIGGTIEDEFYLVDSDGIGGQQPYEVYCDMTTDGGGWTKIGDNFVLNGDFSDGNHALDYPSSTGNWNRENNILLLNNPSGKPYAMRQQAVYGANSEIDYDIVFDDVTSLQVDTELRLSAWVADAWDEGDSTDGGKGYIFQNRLTYTDATYIEDGERIDLDTQSVDGKTWKHQMVRIPITKEVESFKWEVGHGTETSASRDFYFADLKAEIYYR